MALVPRNIRDLEPYRPGKSISALQRELGLTDVIKLASNENPLGPSPKALTAAQRALQAINRYPDPAGLPLREKLAERFRVKVDNVILGAGSEGIMSIIMRTFLLDEDEIISAAGSFIGFRVLAQASGNRVHWVPMRDNRYDLEAMAARINDYTKLIYIANPDNPTGSYITTAEFDRFMDRVPERVLVILDEAYFEYAQELPDYPDSMHYRYDNVITLRTFSKVYGLAGLRIGYGFAHENLISNLLKVKLPFAVTEPAMAAALVALDDEEYLQRSLVNNREGLQRLIPELKDLGYEVLPSATNFVTLLFPTPTDAEKFTNMLLHKGIIVRHLTAFGRPDAVRVTVGSPKEIDRLLEIVGSLPPIGRK